MKILVAIKVVRTDGPTVEADEVMDALVSELEGFEFEAGDEPSVFSIELATAAEA